jgi:hypothetical protein
MNKTFVSGVLVASILVLVPGCGNLFGGKGESGEVKIEKDKAKELELELNIGVGELNVNPGADEWVEGTLEFNEDKFKSEVSYKLKGDKGIAAIEQKEKKKLGDIKIGKVKNTWNLNLNDEIPIDLSVNSGASDTNLDLKGLKLSGLDVDAGVGNVTIDLGGKWEESFDVTLEMGVGKSTIILPDDVGVKIIATKGIGNADFVGLISKGDGVYVNEAFEDADVIINLETDMGVGETIFKVEK